MHSDLGLLLLKHLVQNRQEPPLKLLVVVVRDEKISSSVDALLSQAPPTEGKLSQVGGRPALDEVFFYSACRGYDDVYLVQGGRGRGGERRGGREIRKRNE